MKLRIQLTAELLRAKSLRHLTYCKNIDAISLFLLIIALLFEWIIKSHEFEWIFLASSISMQGFGLYLGLISKKYHLYSRDAYRWFLISDSIDDNGTKENLPLAEIENKILFSNSDLTDNHANNANYYYSIANKGLQRLVHNLHESVWWSSKVLEKSMAKRTIITVITLFACIGLLCFLLSLDRFKYINSYFISLSFLSILIHIVKELLGYISSNIVVKELYYVEQKLYYLFSHSEEELQCKITFLMELMAKYYSLTSVQPVLDWHIYSKLNTQLTANYSEYINQKYHHEYKSRT